MLLHHKALARFTEWFGSGGGVIQTFAVTVLVVVLELAFPRVDPHGFWLLFWMTIYSAVTQPALAYSGAKSQQLLHEVLKNQGDMLHNQADILERIEHMLNKDTVIDRKTYNLVRQIRDNMSTDV